MSFFVLCCSFLVVPSTKEWPSPNMWSSGWQSTGLALIKELMQQLQKHAKSQLGKKLKKEEQLRVHAVAKQHVLDIHSAV